MGWDGPEPSSLIPSSVLLLIPAGLWGRGGPERTAAVLWPGSGDPGGAEAAVSSGPTDPLSSPAPTLCHPHPAPPCVSCLPCLPLGGTLPPPQEEMTSALATMRVDYEQIKIKKIEDASNPLLLKRRKKARALEAAALAH